MNKITNLSYTHTKPLSLISSTLNFIFVEIRTSGKAPTVPSMVQPVTITKLINPLKGGVSFEIIPLLV